MLYSFIFIIVITALWSLQVKNLNSKGFTTVNYNVKNYAKFLFVYLVIMSTFRPDTLADHETYVRIFTQDILEDARYEFGFGAIVSFIRRFTSSDYIYFFVFGCIGVGLKIYTIYKYSPSFFLSMLIYLVEFFVLLDMIQVRNSIAISFYLLAVVFKAKGNWKLFTLFVILSISFHYSASIILILFLIKKDRFLNYYKWIIPASYGLVLAGKTLGYLAGYLPGPFETIFMMNNGSAEELGINIFNSVVICRIIFFYIILHNYDEVSAKYPYTGIMLKLYAIAVSVYVLTSDLPSIAGRLGHFLAAVEILLLPTVIYIRKRHLIYRLFLYAYCTGALIVFLLSEENGL